MSGAPLARPGIRDEAYAILEPLLPEERPAKPGRPHQPHRIIVDGIFWILRTGAPWRDLPGEYGPWGTVYSRFRLWRQNGIWEGIQETLKNRAEEIKGIDWSFGALDGSVVRAHKAAAGAAKTVDGESLTPAQSLEEQALGRSRGGFSTKIHLLVEGMGKPLVALISPGQQHDSRHAKALLDEISLTSEEGTQHIPFDAVAGDKGYDSQAIRQLIRERGSTPVIAHRRNRDGEYPDSAKDFDKEKYRQRNIVERAIGRLKEFRRVATRYEKLASQYLAMLHLAFIQVWLGFELRGP